MNDPTAKLTLPDMVERIGRTLGEHLGPRFGVAGNGATIRVVDRWADNPDFTFTIEESRP